MDEEVRALVAEAYERSLNLMKSKQDQVRLM
jgi:ATP-dependent Zn protease